MPEDTIKDCNDKSIGVRFTELWTIKLGDWGRGLVVAILTVPFGVLLDWATTEGYQINWRSMLKGAVGGFLAYISKNLITGKQGNLLTDSSKSLVTGKENTVK